MEAVCGHMMPGWDFMVSFKLGNPCTRGGLLWELVPMVIDAVLVPGIVLVATLFS